MDLITITHFLNGFLMIALAIVLGIILVGKFRLGWKIWLIGGAIFIISQIVHLPFNSVILNPLLRSIQQGLPGAPGLLVTYVLLGLSAGVFEECARYGMFRWWLKDKRSWRVAILAGAGHGGAEAIILGLLILYYFINLFALRHADLSKLNLAPDQLIAAQQQLQAYWGAPWYDTLLGVVERIFTIPFHIMASVVVMQVFTRRPGQQQMGWLGLAIVLHTLMNASSGFLSRYWSVYSVEALLGGLAIVDIFIIFALRQPEPSEPEETPTLKAPAIFTPEPIEETSDNLEKTRFQ